MYNQGNAWPDQAALIQDIMSKSGSISADMTLISVF